MIVLIGVMLQGTTRHHESSQGISVWRRLVYLEVDESGEASALPLSGYTRSFGRHPIFHDEVHQRGFLHRLDVPSSGLILVASTYEAFYDLQFQLSLGLITRDYTSLCHGCFCGDRDVRASVVWSDFGFHQDTPSQVASGVSSRSHIKLLKLFTTTSSRSFSLLGIRIATGRKHQIRVHLAHVGHPTVSDGTLVENSTHILDILIFRMCVFPNATKDSIQQVPHIRKTVPGARETFSIGRALRCSEG